MTYPHPSFSSLRARALLVALAFFHSFLLPLSTLAEEGRKLSFDIPAGGALTTLKQFVAQSGAQLLYSVDVVEAVKTNRLKGDYTSQEALAHMLAGSNLMGTKEEGAEVFTIRHRAQATATGSITGTVSNSATHANLEGAVVNIEELSLKVLTDKVGRFSFSGLPTGSYNVTVSYTGLETVRETFEIVEGRNLVKDYGLTSEVYQLEKFTVAGEREGNAVSITKQRNADNVVNILSMDSFGNVADGNVGNFMQKLPGIGAIIENGDIVGFGVRGTPSELNAVNVDGVRMSNAYGGANPQGDRAVVVDSIPSDFIKEIELVKALTPDMAADSIGGATNLVTKSALDLENSVLIYRAGVNVNTYRRDERALKPTGSLSYLTKLGPAKKVGLALSGSYTETENTRDRVQMTRSQVDGRNTQARTLDDKAVRTRGGLAAKLDFRPADGLELYTGMQFTYFSFQQVRTDWNIQSSSVNVADYSVVSRAQIEAGTVPRTSTNATAGVAAGFADDYTELLNANFVNTNGSTARHGRAFKFDVGGSQKFSGDQKLSFKASYNPSEYDFVFEYLEARRNGGIGMAVDTRESRERPVYTQTYGKSIGYGADLAGYTSLRAVNDEHSEEEVSSVSLDYEKKFATHPYGLELKSGLDWRQQHRILEVYQPRWNYVGADGVSGTADDDLTRFRSAEPGYSLFNNQYPQRDHFDYPMFKAYFDSNPGLFREQGTTVSTAPRFNEITEDVYAAYAMGKMKFGQLGVLAGIRVEETALSATGVVTDPQNPNVTRVTRDGKYREVFPGVHFRYEPAHGLLMRASYTNGYARPAFGQLYPVTTISYNDSTGLGQVTQNNSSLSPQFSTNYDASIEYYFEPVGVLSASYFYKELKDFIAGSTTTIGNGSDNGFGGNYEGFDLVTNRNFGSATIEGYELNYSQQLRMLPKPFDTLSVFANYTKIKTKGSYDGNSEELVRFIPETANAGLSWRYRNLELRAAYNFKSGYLNTYNVNPVARQRVTDVETWDFNAQYKVTHHVTVFVDVVNAFNKWASWYTSTDPARIIMSEVYGTRVSAGISGRF